MPFGETQTFAACLLFQRIFLYSANYLTYLTSYRAIADLRLQLGDRIRQLPMGFFNERQIGDLNGLVSVADAPIVLLDEATASIDPENELFVQKAINALTASKTPIVIAHHLSTVAAAEQILVLDRGQIVERGDQEHLLALNGVYKKFWDAQQQAKGWKLTAL